MYLVRAESTDLTSLAERRQASWWGGGGRQVRPWDGLEANLVRVTLTLWLRAV